MARTGPPVGPPVRDEQGPDEPDPADTMAGREIAELADHRDALIEALLDTFRTGNHTQVDAALTAWPDLIWRLVDVLVAHQAIDPTYEARVVAALVAARTTLPPTPDRLDADVIPLRKNP